MSYTKRKSEVLETVRIKFGETPCLVNFYFANQKKNYGSGLVPFSYIEKALPEVHREVEMIEQDRPRSLTDAINVVIPVRNRSSMTPRVMASCVGEGLERTLIRTKNLTDLDRRIQGEVLHMVNWLEDRLRKLLVEVYGQSFRDNTSSMNGVLFGNSIMAEFISDISIDPKPRGYRGRTYEFVSEMISQYLSGNIQFDAPPREWKHGRERFEFQSKGSEGVGIMIFEEIREGIKRYLRSILNNCRGEWLVL